MLAIVGALEAAAKLPDFHHRVFSRAPQSARANPGPVGAFMGYDFHLGGEGPLLIEVNTNAGARSSMLSLHVPNCNAAAGYSGGLGRKL
ncbi:hypothetical protein HSBAA_PA_1500 (plasmid) [Vreelandella sulfidaeris]|uniref:ATP-grasp domain-containing protein n=1 Tax=Vreelandella sulfidaeris TaxID=115553 RepID=A0A455UIH6_9GAMM|nr:hypothetical protein HSBAA_PA_1500 [Halomonas sulfidaeris]